MALLLERLEDDDVVSSVEVDHPDKESVTDVMEFSRTSFLLEFRLVVVDFDFLDLVFLTLRASSPLLLDFVLDDEVDRSEWVLDISEGFRSLLFLSVCSLPTSWSTALTRTEWS